jgi:hypothetical protein
MLDPTLATLLPIYDSIYTFRKFGGLTLVAKYAKMQFIGGYNIGPHCDCGSQVKWGHCKHEKMMNGQYAKEIWQPNDIEQELEYLASKDFPNHRDWKNLPENTVKVLTVPFKSDSVWWKAVCETDGLIIEFLNLDRMKEYASQNEKRAS